MAEKKQKLTTVDKTCIKGTCLSSFGDNSNVACVDVKDDKIVRIRPLHYDWKYKPEEFNPWKFEARGKTFIPPLKSLVPPHGTAYKKRIYSPNRILYPLKRVDWDPKGERNPQNRGKSKYVRISWDEALDIVVSEIKRIQKKYGPEGILSTGRRPWREQSSQCRSWLFHLPDEADWEVILSKSAIRIAGKAGTGEPSMSGATNRSALIWNSVPIFTNDVAKNTEMLDLPGL